MAQNTSDQSGAVPSDKIIFETMDEDEALKEDERFEQLDPKPLDELFDAVVDRVRDVVLLAANSLKYKHQTSTEGKTRVKQYLQMNTLLLSLQHWGNDIQVENKSPLSITEEKSDRFNSLALIVRTKLLDIILACSLIEKATEKTRQGSIDHLDQLSRQLLTFVTPLRTFLLLEETLDLDNPRIVRTAASRLDTHRLGGFKGNGMKDNTSLPEQISRCLIQSHFDPGAQRRFAPNGKIKGLIVSHDVRATLAKGLPSVHKEVGQDLVDYIVFEARNLFAICLEQNLEKHSLLKAMVLFKENSMSDDDLPLERTELPPPVTEVGHGDDEFDDNDWGESSQKSLGTEDTTVSSTLTKNFDSRLHEIDPDEEIWGFQRRRAFIETEQWVFLAPVFSTKDDNRDLEKASVLPFTTRGVENRGGGFGLVSEIEIQEGHIEDPGNLFGSKMPSSYALKQIRPNSSDPQKVVTNWTKELANLRSVTRLKLPNILRFVTAFRRESGKTLDHYLICEWADGGDLRSFWNSEKSPKATPGLVEEVVTQLFGLAEALCTLHYWSEGGIVHGDLKPENILRFKTEGSRPGLLGTLKIGDWGLSKEKDCKTADQNNASIYRASIKYEPPEMSEGVLVMGRNALLKTRSRLYDMWSFGCIMLEFIVWLAEGAVGLASFETLIGVSGNNQFWEKQIGHRLGVNAQLQVRASIRRKMDELDQQAACKGTALGDLLHFVRNRALVVHLPTYLAALEPGDLKGLKPDELARLNSVGAALPWSTSRSQDEPVDGGFGLNRAQTMDWINSINSYDSENPHAEAAEIVEKLTIEVTGPDSSPASTSSLEVMEPNEPPRAKATELLKTMRQIMMLAAEQAGSNPTGSSTISSAKQPLWATSAGENTATTASNPPSLVFSDNTAATSSVETAPSVPKVYLDSGDVAASQNDPSKIPGEASKSGSLGVTGPQNVGDDPERPLLH